MAWFKKDKKEKRYDLDLKLSSGWMWVRYRENLTMEELNQERERIKNAKDNEWITIGKMETRARDIQGISWE